MEPISILITLIIILLVFLTFVTLAGHAIWLIVAAIVRSFAPASKAPDCFSPCPNCQNPLADKALFCSVCGITKPSGITVELIKDLAATGRQLERFHRSGVVDSALYETLKGKLESERLRLLRKSGPQRPKSKSIVPPVPLVSEIWNSRPDPSECVDRQPTPPPSAVTVPASVTPAPPQISAVSTVELKPNSDNGEPKVQAHKPVAPPRPRRKPLSEVISAFMEQSNIRWGEIIGGLLIIGCSTALVISLWTEISRIPVLKFSIFTTVTAALFGIGLYTEHRWKLPTTSRGILTIATLLVPLNFLAIAAVSGGASQPDTRLIISELVAPAVFLWLVYFAGRVITPSWPHLLTGGVLGSSIGQLLVRHFAALDISPALLVALGAFPTACYVATSGWMLRKPVAKSEITEQDTTSIFITLGAFTFAAILPFGLLLYKTGPIGMTMMYLAPLVSLTGLPALAIGTLLWSRITDRNLLAQRTGGTALALLGTIALLLGMILAWPNPASIIPAALLIFAVLTVLALWLEIPAAHFVASLCLGLAYLVLYHVTSVHVSWQNLRVTSLLDVSISASSGHALALLFVLFLGASEWFQRNQRKSDSRAYLGSSLLIGALSISLITIFGLDINGNAGASSLAFGLYAVGAFWVAARRNLEIFSWIGSALLLAALAEAFSQWQSISFPWQTAFLVHASVCAVAAIVSSQFEKNQTGPLVKVFNRSALISSFIIVLCLVQAGKFETTPMQAQRVLWLSAIWLGLLWLNRQRWLFAVFQIAVACGAIISVKAMLQQYEWYSYLPQAFMHPWSLQIQGVALALFCLTWTTLRFSTRKAVRQAKNQEIVKGGWLLDASHLLDSRFAFDRLLSWFLLDSFGLLALYGAWSGAVWELTADVSHRSTWNLANFRHTYAFGLGSWVVLGLLIVAFLMNFRERGRYIYCLGAVGLLTTISPLLAARWETELATASAWRWIAAALLAFTSGIVWYRKQILSRFNPGYLFEVPEAENLPRLVRAVVLVLTVVPLVLFTAYPALKAILYLPVHAPSPAIFFLLGNEFLYGVPLIIVGIVLVGYSLRDKLPSYAFAGGWFFNLAVSMFYLLSVVAARESMNRVVVTQVIQLNAIAIGLYSLVWLGTRKYWMRHLNEDIRLEAQRTLGIQMAICMAANLILIAPVAIKLVARPDLAGIGTFEAGNTGGWLAFLAATVTGVWFARSNAKQLKPAHLFATLLAATCLSGFAAARWDVGNWTGFHTLILGTLFTTSLLILARSMPAWFSQSTLQRLGLRLSNDWPENCAVFATIAGLLATFLALRARWGEPTTAWWSIAPLLVLTCVSSVLHWQTLKRAYLYAAGILLSSSAVIWWGMLFPGARVGRRVEVIVVSLCISSIIWLVLELRARGVVPSSHSTAWSLHNLAACGSLGIIGFYVVLRLASNALGVGFPAPAMLDWLSIASIIALLVACSWDVRAKHSVAGLYLAGLLTIALVLDQLNLSAHHLAWAFTVAFALFSLLATLAWHWREEIMRQTDQLKISRRLEPTVTGLQWLTGFNLVLIAVVCSFTYWIDLTFFDWTLRATASCAVITQFITMALLAEGSMRAHWQRAAIAVFILGIVFLGWSGLTPGVSGTWLNRSVILMIEMFGLTAAYGLMLEKGLRKKPDWTRAGRECIPWVLAAATIALVFTLCTEIFYQMNFGVVRINPISRVAVGLTLVASILAGVLFALSAKHDPLNLSEKGRMKYVYAAEVMLALLFMHVRLTMPWLFTGFFDDYWPFVVMTVAYLGVIASEALRRRNLLVLAQPIERTGAFLPLLPVIGFWVAQSRVDYSILLFLVGGVYGGLSILRRSFAFGLLAAIAGNGGLWYMLHRTQNYGFLQHPQLWLIPVALSILVAAYLNREQFSEEQMTNVRYFSLLMIYASSTADIFVNGVADSPWLPLILAALSLCGIFAGISLRIRGLLLIGSVFLLFAIITMIYYASVNLGWTWAWYVAGIVTGATIIFMFAVFEKKRSEVLRVVEGFKDWDT